MNRKMQLPTIRPKPSAAAPWLSSASLRRLSVSLASFLGAAAISLGIAAQAANPAVDRPQQQSLQAYAQAEPQQQLEEPAGKATAESDTSEEQVAETGEPAFDYAPLQPEAHYPALVSEIRRILEGQHYTKMRLDDELSEQILMNYISNLDNERNILLRSQVQQFVEQYRHSLDDVIRVGDLLPAFYLANLFRKRGLDRLDRELENLSEKIAGMDFTRHEELLLDRELAEWQTDEAAVDDLWRRYLKNQVLSLRLKDEKSDEEIVKKLRERLTDQRRNLRRFRAVDVFNVFMNSYTELYDSHTNYMSPSNAENFNISMRLSLEGIGAVLTQMKQYVEVVSISPGGPAEKQGELQAGDRIIAVAQGDAPFENIIGLRLDDVISKIRGPRGSTIRLRVLAAGIDDITDAREFAIVRDRIQLEQQAAKKKIIEVKNDGKDHRVAVISLPSFYLDFRGRDRHERNYRSSTRDVLRLLDELREEDIAGLIFDLRSNGGGSLQEANSMVGLFIGSGPTVQVKRSSGRIIRQGKIVRSAYFDKPLLVLINRLSASASEIFSGAIQDYGRGLVVGGQSFGKGTVQSIHPLSAGQLKITDAKFYRISGASTQLKGVIPHIMFPPLVDRKKVGEDTLDFAMPWDQIGGVRHRAYGDYEPLLPELLTRHRARINAHPEFLFLEARREYWLEKEEEDSRVSLHEQSRIDRHADRKSRWEKLEKIRNPDKKTDDTDNTEATAGLEDDAAEAEGPKTTVAESKAGPSETSDADVAAAEIRDVISADAKTATNAAAGTSEGTDATVSAAPAAEASDTAGAADSAVATALPADTSDDATQDASDVAADSKPEEKKKEER